MCAPRRIVIELMPLPFTILTDINAELSRNANSINNTWIDCDAKKHELRKLDSARLHDAKVSIVDIESLELECLNCFNRIDEELKLRRQMTEKLTVEVITNLFRASGFGDRSEFLAVVNYQHVKNNLEVATASMEQHRREYDEERREAAEKRKIALNARQSKL